MIRLLTAVINLHTHKTIDAFSGDYLCTLEEGETVLNFLEKQGMAPPETFVLVPIESDGNQYPLVPGDFKLEDGLWYTPQQRVWDKE